MYPRARRIAIPLAGLAAAAGGLVAVPAANAAADDDVVSRNARTTVEQTVTFWTPERLRAATNADDGLTSRGSSGSAGRPDGPPGSVPPIGQEGGKSAKAKHVNLPNTVGRVFFIDGAGKPRYCSATSVQGKYRNLVATSAHCVYDVKHNQFMDKWVFIPSYWDGDHWWEGKAPYGIYAAKTFNAHDDFVVKEDFDYDYAFVNVYNGYKLEWKKVGGKWTVERKLVGRLGDNVGGQGFTWNRSTKATVFSFGYPAGEHPDGDKPYSGRTMKWCYGKTAPMPAAPKYRIEEHVGFKCAFTSGASGGPMLYNYRNSSRTGYLYGVNSVAWDTDGNDRYDHISSPYFNGDTYKVYKAAANRWTGNPPAPTP
ncbi:trypsin-like serine peptidase [Thermoactinospora rubra]|uniref:trypsin-like serine peptidase n=1 Tax=Thermoactinospora rubra TaxID=1088767 RepID=UPI000A121A5F|nr:trypsin-like peptidase domain-containing protein [Thermoactinospora rubra]